jgi:hypothetical protein
MTIMADPAPTKWALGNDGQYTQITNGTTVLATATDGSVRQIILGVSGFSAGLTTNGREVMTGADGNQMDTESFLASLHVHTNDIKDRDGNTIVAAGKEVPQTCYSTW